MAKTVPSTAVEQRTRAVVLELLDPEGQIEGETRSVRRSEEVGDSRRRRRRSPPGALCEDLLMVTTVEVRVRLLESTRLMFTQ